MASIDQIRAGLAAFYDNEIRKTLPQTKGIIYGAAVGMALAKPEKLIAKILPAAQMLGIMDEGGNVDIETMTREIKKQIAASGGEIRMELNLNMFNPADRDVFRFTAQDVDRLIDYIRR